MSNQPRTIRLDPADNVAVALDALAIGDTESSAGVAATAAVPAGHKMAVEAIPTGEPVRKFNQIIGFASADIAPGEHVHVHNCAFQGFERDYAYGVDAKPTAFVPDAERATFQGYRRANGRVGTRNYIGILSSVNCSATVIKQMADRLTYSGVLDQYPNIDGVVAFAHGSGCGMDMAGEGFANLQRVMHGFAGHPNFGAVVMVGLGCEVFQISMFKETFSLEEGKTFLTLVMQEMGGSRKTIESGVQQIEAMLPHVNDVQRETVSASELTVALQCGGSDGYSGITANPAMGAAADLLVRHGGTAILAETPEIYGAEHLLTRRAASREVGEKLVERIKWWENYTAMHGGVMDNNPSPGNKAGGLTTILEKSLGAAAKGGTTNLNGVFRYAEPIGKAKGFLFMDSPGYDPCSITGEVASGANLVCFSTGRGSAFGFKPAPSVKLATNTAMYVKLEEDMDINCGPVVDEGRTIEDMGAEIFRYWLDCASGAPSKSEALGYGDHEFVPWQVGTVM
ncbi:MAG: altronate dehydratase family protein [Rhodospirillaceae bacterium]